MSETADDSGDGYGDDDVKKADEVVTGPVDEADGRCAAEAALVGRADQPLRAECGWLGEGGWKENEKGVLIGWSSAMGDGGGIESTDTTDTTGQPTATQRTENRRREAGRGQTG